MRSWQWARRTGNFLDEAKMTMRWFELGKARFLIRPPNPDLIFSLNEKRKKGELDLLRSGKLKA
jgi:hypothetical protein